MPRKSQLHAAGRQTTTHTPDGVEIIAREDAYGVHPHPAVRKNMGDRLSHYRDVTKVLLANGKEGFECDFCGWVVEDSDPLTGIRSISSHVNGKHRRSKESRSLYSADTLKFIIREIEYQRRLVLAHRRRDPHSHRANVNVYKIVADKLNKTGVKTVQGQPWGYGAVYSLYKLYRDKHRVMLTKAQTTAIRDAFTRSLPSGSPVAAEVSISDLVDDDTAAKLRNSVSNAPKPSDLRAAKKVTTMFNATDGASMMFDRLARHRRVLSEVVSGGILNLQTNLTKANDTLNDLTNEMNAFVESVENYTPAAAPMDPEIVEKASRYDALKDLLGYKFENDK